MLPGLQSWEDMWISLLRLREDLVGGRGKVLTEGQSSQGCRNSEKLPWPRCYCCSVLVHQEKAILSDCWCLTWAKGKELLQICWIFAIFALSDIRQCPPHSHRVWWHIRVEVLLFPGTVLDTVGRHAEWRWQEPVTTFPSNFNVGIITGARKHFVSFIVVNVHCSYIVHKYSWWENSGLQLGVLHTWRLSVEWDSHENCNNEINILSTNLFHPLNTWLKGVFIFALWRS